MRRLAILVFALCLPTLLMGQDTKASSTPSVAAAPHRHTARLSDREMIAHIASRKLVEPPGLREPSLTAHGLIAVRLCFDATGKPQSIRVVSGPSMMQQPVLESMTGWTFLPVRRGSTLIGGCGLLKIKVDMAAGQVSSALE